MARKKGAKNWRKSEYHGGKSTKKVSEHGEKSLFEKRTMLDPNSRNMVYDEVDDFNAGSLDTNLKIYNKMTENIFKQNKKEDVMGLGEMNYIGRREREPLALPESDDNDDAEYDDTGIREFEKGDSEDSDDDLKAKGKGKKPYQDLDADDFIDDDLEEEEEVGVFGNRKVLHRELMTEGTKKKKNEKDKINNFYTNPSSRKMGETKEQFFGTDFDDSRINTEVKKRSKAKKYIENDMLDSDLQNARDLQERMRMEIHSHANLLSKRVFASAVDEVEKEKELEPDQEGEDEDSESETSAPAEAVSGNERSDAIKDMSPQLLSLLCDIEVKSKEMKRLLCPLIEAQKEDRLPADAPNSYLQTRYLLCLNYLCSASSYVMLSCSGADAEKHPVSKRLNQFRQLFKELEFPKMKYTPVLEKILSTLESKREVVPLLSALRKTAPKSERREVRVAPIEAFSLESDDDDSSGDNLDALSDPETEKEREKPGTEGANQEGADGQEKRMVTKDVMKNRGANANKKFVASRQKLRKKYEKKMRQRKHMVPKMRPKMTRYDGELTGITKNVVKSTKFK